MWSRVRLVHGQLQDAGYLGGRTHSPRHARELDGFPRRASNQLGQGALPSRARGVSHCSGPEPGPSVRAAGAPAARPPEGLQEERGLEGRGSGRGKWVRVRSGVAKFHGTRIRLARETEGGTSERRKVVDVQ